MKPETHWDDDSILLCLMQSTLRQVLVTGEIFLSIYKTLFLSSEITRVFPNFKMTHCGILLGPEACFLCVRLLLTSFFVLRGKRLIYFVMVTGTSFKTLSLKRCESLVQHVG